MTVQYYRTYPNFACKATQTWKHSHVNFSKSYMGWTSNIILLTNKVCSIYKDVKSDHVYVDIVKFFIICPIVRLWNKCLSSLRFHNAYQQNNYTRQKPFETQFVLASSRTLLQNIVAVYNMTFYEKIYFVRQLSVKCAFIITKDILHYIS